MEFNFASNVPLYQQVADEIEGGILQGIYLVDEQIPSTTEISKHFKINPATVLKGMNLLVDSHIIEKRRGLGMFVCQGAKERLILKGKKEFMEEDVQRFLARAQELGFESKEITQLIEEGWREEDD